MRYLFVSGTEQGKTKGRYDGHHYLLLERRDFQPTVIVVPSRDSTL